MKNKPTIDFYTYLAEAFDFFNKRLYENTLTPVMFVITRKKNVAGHFRRRGWLNEGEDTFHEIAVNPQHFISASPLELCQTIVHEQCHQWQVEHGTESRGGYHNTEWADKMRSIGLEPISKNGKGTGQAVGDKPIPGGLFEQACIDFFLMGYKLAIVDGAYNTGGMLKQLNDIIADRVREHQNSSSAALDLSASELSANDSAIIVSSLSTPITEFYHVEVPEAQAAKQAYVKKTTWQCGGCGIKAWGAPSIRISCTPCNTAMSIVA